MKQLVLIAIAVALVACAGRFAIGKIETHFEAQRIQHGIEMKQVEWQKEKESLDAQGID